MVAFTHFKGKHLFPAFTALLLSLSMVGNAQPAKKSAVSDRMSAARMASSSEITASQSNCVLDTELEVIETSFGSPLTGPFKAGEQVTFRYTIHEYTGENNGCQWLQGIVPIFGNGWDPNSFQANGRPANAVDPLTQYTGNWDWYDEDQITYKWDSPYYNIYSDSLSGRKKMCYYLDSNCVDTGVVSGEGMPAGWFAYSPGGSPCCESTGDPNVGWGDGASCTTMGGWAVEFTLNVRPFSEPEACDNEENADLSVQVFTFSDGETGCYSCSPQSNNEICAEDVPHFAAFEKLCCEGPETQSRQLAICTGEEIAVLLESESDSTVNVSYFWTVEAPSRVMGATAGSGDEIVQELTNIGDTSATVTYTVIAVDEEGCSGRPADIVVTVYSALQVTAYPASPLDGCPEAEPMNLGAYPTARGGNGGPYNYTWNQGLPNVPNPTITPTDSTVYTLTVSDTSGCMGMDEVEVIISSELDLNLVGDTVFCPGDSVLIQQVIPLSGIAPYQIEWDGPTGSQSGDSAILTEPGMYTVEVIDTIGCSGSREIAILEDDCLDDAIVSYNKVTPFEVHFSVEFSKSSAIDFRWEFGDGNESTETNPVHTYAEEGDYDLRFIWGNEYSTDTVSLDIEIITTSLSASPFPAVRVFPNPASGKVSIAGLPVGARIALYDMNGKEIYNVDKETRSQHQLQLSDVPPGMYILSITHEGIVERKKLVVK